MIDPYYLGSGVVFEVKHVKPTNRGNDAPQNNLPGPVQAVGSPDH